MTSSTPPVAARNAIERTHHGDTVIDHYEWLRDKESPETRALLEAENAWSDEQTAHLQELRETIFDEIRSRTLETDLSVPVRDGDWWYYARTVEGQQYALRCRVKAEGDDWTPPATAPGTDVPGEQILLDSNEEAAGHEFFSLGAFTISDDGNLLAWSVDTQGDERYTIRIKDLRTGDVLSDEIAGASAGATWSAHGSHLFYSTVDDAWRPHRIWRHEVGGAADDVLVFEEPDDRYFIGVGRTASDKYLVIGVGSKVTSETRILEADDPTGEFRVLLPRREGVEHSAEHAIVGGRDVFLVLHNDGAANFELAWLDVDASPDDLNVILPASPDVRLDDIDVFAHHIAVSYREDALPKVGLMPIGDDGFGALDPIALDEELFSCGVGGNASWDPPYLRIGTGSFITPASVFDLDFATRELTLRRRQPVLGGYEPGDYEQHRVWATAPDGTHVPMSIVTRRDTPHDGTAPALIYGYGAYEASIDPGFSVARLSLLDRGFVFAVAHVRGGGEMGRRWYDDGKMLNKTHTFTDFIACAEQLVADGWTSADRLVAEGGSAGGLLMGAIANLAPEAFAGILASVPFVDPLTSILDPSLPLTVIEWDEWGNPLDDPDVYAYMKAYSPYENVGPHSYPAILAMTSLNDTRVLYVEPAKWVSRLRAEARTDNPILLRTEMSAGHGGVSGRYAAWRERAWELAWIIDTATRRS